MLPRKYLPDGAKILEPSRMNQEEATALLEFWHNHQEASDGPILKFSWWWCKDWVEPPVRELESDTEEESPVMSSNAKKTKKSTSKSSQKRTRSNEMDDGSTGTADNDRPARESITAPGASQTET